MGEDEFKLDEHLRRRLKSAARMELPVPSRDGPALVQLALRREVERRARVRRLGARVVGGLLAAASLLLGYRLAYAPVPEQRAGLAAPACALPVGPSSRFEPREGRETLELGRFGRVVAAPGAVLRIARADACELELELSHGELAFDLHKLQPARLRVRTPLATVHVRGTQFSVRVADDVDVVLVSGSVEITDAVAETTRLTAGHRLRSRSGGRKSTLSKATSADTQTFHALLSSPDSRLSVTPDVPAPDVPTKSEPEPAPEASDRREIAPDVRAPASPKREKTVRDETKSTADLLAEAEKERRARHLDEARALYERASARQDPDAEVALLRWARLEQSERRQAAAHKIVRRYLAAFPTGRLRAEAQSLEVRLLRELGRPEEAKAAARELVKRHPDSPHARAAREEVLR